MDASFVSVSMMGSWVSQNQPAGHSLPPTVQKVEQKPFPDTPTKQLHAAGVVVFARSAVVHAWPTDLVGAVTVVRQRPDVLSHDSFLLPAPGQSESAVHPPRQKPMPSDGDDSVNANALHTSLPTHPVGAPPVDGKVHVGRHDPVPA
jgi:hypothetical protein